MFDPDAGALGLAIWAQALSSRPRSHRKTFGYRRAEILAAAANGIVLGITALAVIAEAIRRFASPPPRRGRLSDARGRGDRPRRQPRSAAWSARPRQEARTT